MVACVTVVPFAVPQATLLGATVTAADPVFVGSATLVAVMVYVPAAWAANVAVRPLAVNVAVVGETLHETELLHAALAFTVAVSVDVAPIAIFVGVAATVTPETVHVGDTLPVCPSPLDPHAA